MCTMQNLPEPGDLRADVVLPPAAALVAYDTLELDFALGCAGRADADCPQWDHVLQASGAAVLVIAAGEREALEEQQQLGTCSSHLRSGSSCPVLCHMTAASASGTFAANLTKWRERGQQLLGCGGPNSSCVIKELCGLPPAAVRVLRRPKGRAAALPALHSHSVGGQRRSRWGCQHHAQHSAARRRRSGSSIRRSPRRHLRP